ETAKCKMTETPFAQMLEGQPGRRGVIGPDRRQAEVLEQVPDVDRGDAELADAVGDLAAFDAGDDAVAFPILKPRRAGFAQAAFLEEDGPGTMFADVAGDAEKGAAAIGAGRLDQQRDARAV